MRVIGLSGGIGTGKSEVSRMLQDLGALTIDADLLAHQTYFKGSKIWQAIVSYFGKGVLTPEGYIDRQELGSVVFAKQRARKKLESLVWPEVKLIAEREIRQIALLRPPMIVLEAAVLIEAGWCTMVDEIWLTYATKDMVIRRLKESKGLSEKQVNQRISSQLSFLKQRRHAKVIIENTNTMDALRKTVRSLWKTYQKDKSSTNG